MDPRPLVLYLFGRLGIHVLLLHLFSAGYNYCFFCSSVLSYLSLSLSPSLPPSLSLSPSLHLSFSLLLLIAYITRCEVHSVYKRLSDKRYVYMILVEWSDGTQYTVRRTYGDFFSFQTKVCVAKIHVTSLTTMLIDTAQY